MPELRSTHRAARAVQKTFADRGRSGTASPQLRRDQSPGVWEFVTGRWPASPSSPRRCRQSPTSCSPGSSSAARGTSPARVFQSAKKNPLDVEVLEDLMEMLAEIAPQGQFLWNNKQVVPIYVPEQHEPWRGANQKARCSVLAPDGPRALHAGTNHRPRLHPEWDGQRPNADVIRLKFAPPPNLARGDLRGFFREHLAAVRGSSG